MSEFENLLDELEAVFASNLGYFRSPEPRLAVGMYEQQAVPILECVVREARRLLDKQYRLSGDSKSVELVHYTSIDSLVSILGGVESLNGITRASRENPDCQRASARHDASSIRLYDTEHFNDPDEGQYLIRSLRLHETYQWLEPLAACHAYVASFIRASGDKRTGDDLVFWRTYGDNGAGCSITVPMPSQNVRCVLYGEEGTRHQGVVMYALLDRLDHIISEYELPGEIQVKLSATVWELLQPFLYMHKSRDYEYERECRFIVPFDNEFRDEVLFECEERFGGPPRIRHYIEKEELDARNILVSGSRVTLGPRVDQHRSAELLLETLLRRSRLQTQLRFSEISYREPQ